MSLDPKWRRLRDALNAQGGGHRVLEDDDVIQRGDETACGSTLLSGSEDWEVMTDGEFMECFGRTVRDMNDRSHNNEMDTEERLFRRRR